MCNICLRLHTVSLPSASRQSVWCCPPEKSTQAVVEFLKHVSFTGTKHILVLLVPKKNHLKWYSHFMISVAVTNSTWQLSLQRITQEWRVTLTQLVIVWEAKSIHMAFFWHSKGEVRSTEGVNEVNFPFHFYHLWNQQPLWDHKNKQEWCILH